jgi:UDP-N-acetylglucosamine--N-acetylmuramyl-(pentapeptide) pyrophosphoryl-undecaprenol N-acetylglucosamine transferase
MGLKVALACGGTGGHVFPALAVGRALRERHGAELVVIGRPASTEMKWAQDAGCRFCEVPAVPLSRSRVWINATLPVSAIKAVSVAKRVLREEAPAAVFATGGYVSLPTGIAARLLRIPLLVHESNSHPGVTNRLLARIADRVFAGSPAGAARLPRAEAVGSPVRPLDGRSRAQMRADLGLTDSDKFLVVIGGSQGARGINRILTAEAGALHERGWRILWQTGPSALEAARAAISELPGVKAEAFVTDVYGAFGAADLALTRSGASTLAELALHGLPTVLVPFPSATGNHQEINAREFESAGAAAMLTESAYTEGAALRAVEALWTRRAEASRAMLSFARPDCANVLADAVAQAAVLSSAGKKQ